MPKEKYVVFFGDKVNGTFNFIAKKNVKKGASEITYKKEKFVLDSNVVVYRRKNVSIYMMDLGGTQLKSTYSEFSLSNDIIDNILRRRIGVQFFNGMSAGISIAWLQILIGLGMGVPIGMVVIIITKLGVA
jgi:hypothetical protein